MTRERPAVRLLATGGTIANPPTTEGYLTGEELLEEIPPIESVADVDVADVASTGSSGVTPTIWLDLLTRIERDSSSGTPPDGFVITHGSNTVEETAYFLHLAATTDRPIVLTAAQRNHGTLGSDGDRNLLDAIRVAAHPAATGHGALVIVNDEIHGARAVTKTVSGRPDAWDAGDFGPLGLIDKRGQIRFYRRSIRSHGADTPFDLDRLSSKAFPQIEIVYSAAFTDGSLVDIARERGVDGLVVAALPTGTPAAPDDRVSQLAALERAADAGIPVVISHRGQEGWPKSTLLSDDRFIWGDTLTPQKARILLALGLSNTDDYGELREYFTLY